MGLEIEGLSAQVQATERQLALLGEELEAQLSLSAKGLADRAQLSALQQQEAALLGKIAQLRAKRAEAQTQLHELKIDRLRQITADHKAAITALRDLHPPRAAAARRSPPTETRAGGAHPHRADQRGCPWADHFQCASGRTTGQTDLASCAQ